MSTRELFKARYRRIAAEYGPDVAAIHYEFVHGYPTPRIHGRIRQPLSETQRTLISPAPIGSILPEETEEIAESKPKSLTELIDKMIESHTNFIENIPDNALSRQVDRTFWEMVKQMKLAAQKKVRLFKE